MEIRIVKFLRALLLTVICSIAYGQITSPSPGGGVYALTVAEIAAGFAPSGKQLTYEPYDLRRYGGVGDGATDNTAAINLWINVCQRVTTCFVYPGTYKTTGNHTITSGFNIIGRGGGEWYTSAPLFVLTQNATNLFNWNGLNNSGPTITGLLVSGVTFDGGSFTVSDALLAIQGVTLGTLRDVGLHHVVGNGMRLRQVWDSQIDNCFFRGIDAHSATGVVIFDSRYNSDNNQNVNNLSLRHVHLENNQGTYLYGASDSNLFMLRVDDSKFEVGSGSAGGPFPLIDLKAGSSVFITNNSQFDNFRVGNGYDRLFKFGDTSAATSVIAYHVSGNLIHGIDASTYYIDTQAGSNGTFDRNFQDDNNFGLVTNSSNRAARFERPMHTTVQSDIGQVYSRAQDALNGFIGVDRLGNSGPTSFTQNVNSLSDSQDVLVSPATPASILVSLPVPPFSGAPGALVVGVRCFSASGVGTLQLQYNTSFTNDIACPATTFGTVYFTLPQSALGSLSGSGSNRFRLSTGSTNGEAVTVDGVYLQQQNVPATLSVNSLTAQTTQTPVNIIYDDDCTSDVDCVYTLSALHHWIDQGYVNVLAYMANSQNTGAAPIFKIFNTYWGHSTPNSLIGAYKGSNVTSTGNTSSWVSNTVTQFDAGDTSSNYPNCVTTYRQVLARAQNSSVVMVSTGFLGCIAGLMASSADSISASTGAQLIQAKVTALYLMGGDYPSGTEYNMVNDSTDANYVFANWTTQNGYPNINMNGFTPGNSLAVGRPVWYPTTDPSQYAAGVVSTTSRPGWDILSLYQAIFGLSSFTASANGTNSVNSGTGANTWSSGTASGHIYYTLTSSAAVYNALLDGKSFQGAAWWQPAQNTSKPAIQGPGILCTSIIAGCQLLGSWASFSGSVNYPLINASNSISSSSFYTIAQFLEPNMTSNQQLNIQLGHDAATKNLASMDFTYSGNGNASNRWGVGFYGTNEVITAYADARFQIAGGYSSTGTKFTTSGCSISSTTGGAQAGTFTLGANTCSAIVTMNGATGVSAPSGWSCSASDRTAPTVLISQSASSTTTATFSIPAGAGTTDVISFHCTGY